MLAFSTPVSCRCGLAAYFPGLSIPGDATTYDPKREAERERQRELERGVRGAKRDYAAGIGTRQDVRDAQKAVRDHLDTTGTRRRYDREQLWFQDGGPKRTAPRRTPPSVPSPTADQVVPRVATSERRAPHIPAGLDLKPHEITTAERLADVGLHMRFRPLVAGDGVKNPDGYIGGDLWDLKTPSGGGKHVISDQLKRAKRQGVRHVVIDMYRSPLDDAATLAEIRRRVANSDWWTSVIHIAKDGTVTRVNRRP